MILLKPKHLLFTHFSFRFIALVRGIIPVAIFLRRLVCPFTFALRIGVVHAGRVGVERGGTPQRSVLENPKIVLTVPRRRLPLKTTKKNNIQKQ